VGDDVGDNIGDNMGDDMGDNYGSVIAQTRAVLMADDGRVNDGRLRRRQRWQGGTFNGGGDGQPQGGGVKKRCNNQIDYNEDNKGRSKELGGRIWGLVGRCQACHRAAAKKTAAGGGEVPRTMAPELSASTTSLEGARPLAIRGGRD
jgi:hypothetical protein